MTRCRSQVCCQIGSSLLHAFKISIVPCFLSYRNTRSPMSVIYYLHAHNRLVGGSSPYCTTLYGYYFENDQMVQD
uniref:Uncharacterized protein n=1 Tax=Arundo donax TaxID=35708 RepID=A0A0A9GIU6_ARUDO